VIRRVREVASEALGVFPELQEVRLVGSLATGTETGTSDIDLALRVDRVTGNPLEALRPYFLFFSRRVPLALDVLLVGPEVSGEVERVLREGLVLVRRGDSVRSG